MREAPIKVRVHEPHALRDFGIRALTALAMGVVLIAADLWGGVVVPGGGMLVWAVAVALVALTCSVELYGLMRTEHTKPNAIFGTLAVAAMPIVAALYATHLLPNSGASTSSELGAVGLTAVIGGLVLVALTWQMAFRQVNISDTAITVFGALYAGFTLSHLVLMRALDSGAELVIITLAGVWAMDVLAYLVGSAIGKHRLAPHISPRKSWEGLAAGTVGTVAAWGIGWWWTQSPLGLWWFLLIGVVAAAAALVGDLAESALKREVGAKDSGTLLPGHGGFLDRFDSLIVVSIVVYYMLLFGGAR
jgi:phosphatidate cytidylyltransferase